MNEQVQVTLDKKLYDRLLELEVPPYNDVNAVIDRLLYHAGRSSREATQLESEETHYTMEDELRRASEGVYAGSGINT
ncbi:MAG: hypothetical protein OQK94_10650 [Gammaproteobacteria bacterium]|nr:hypothetical protein [Gammaproteobacteria bacterium]MCW8840420.1 hypothetical protein [Gammaproteobacteria bacterium]MCW8973070.1 hypothetical protein [Gammaproteobacteria bacterium]MCW8993512.1 hypothetical protein [Gammaproteobacteria bacterium]